MRRTRPILLLPLLAVLAVTRPSLAQTTFGPVVGQSGDHFTVDGTPKFLLMVSYFDALHMNPAVWDGDLDYLVSKGYSGVRIFANWFADYCTGTEPPNIGSPDTVFNHNGTLNTAMVDKLKTFLGKASQRGLVVDLTFTHNTVLGPNGTMDPGMSMTNYETALRAITSELNNQLNAYRNVIFDVHNEYPQWLPGDVDAVAATLVSAVNQTDSSRVVSASRAESDGSSDGSIARDRGFDVVAFHDSRDLDLWYLESTAISRLNAIRSGLSPTTKPIYYQEPMPFSRAPGCSTGIQDRTPTNARNAAKWARRYGAAAWTFHTRDSFELAGTSLVARLSADSTQQIELEAIKANIDSVCWGVSGTATFSEPGLTLGAGAGSQNVTVDTNGVCAAGAGWTVTPSTPGATWVTVSPTTGSGTTSITVTVQANPMTSVRNASFTLGNDRVLTVTQAGSTTPSHTLTVTKSGPGTVTSTPAGINCGSTCSTSYPEGTAVALTETPSTSFFMGWGGACSGTATTCNVTMTTAKSITATFAAILPGLIQLNADAAPDVFMYNSASGARAVAMGGAANGYTTTTQSALSQNWKVFPQDVNQDGFTDFLLYNDGSVGGDPNAGRWYDAIGDGAGGFTFVGSDGNPSRPAWSTGWKPVILDLNGDGKSDIFFYNDVTGAWWQGIRNGPGQFTFLGVLNAQNQMVAGTWTTGLKLYAAKFNADAYADLFVYKPSTGDWWRVVNAGAPNYLPSSPPQGSPTWATDWTINVGDFNGDGLSDLFLYNNVPGHVYAGKWWEVDSIPNSSAFDPHEGDLVWSPAWKIWVGDFNADGKNDLFLYNPGNGQYYKALRHPTSWTFTYVGGFWSTDWQANLTDANADGKSDVLVYNATTGRWILATTGNPTADFTYTDSLTAGNPFPTGMTLYTTRPKLP